MKPALTPAVFLEAARRVAESESAYACCAADKAAREVGFPYVGSDTAACTYLTRVLMPPYAGSLEPWYGHVTDQNQTARVLGLILCSLLVKEGFRP